MKRTIDERGVTWTIRKATLADATSRPGDCIFCDDGNCEQEIHEAAHRACVVVHDRPKVLQ